MSEGWAVFILSLTRTRYFNPVCPLQYGARDALTDQGDRRGVVPQLVNGEDATADHLCLGGEEGGEHEARTVAQHQILTQIQSLQQHKQKIPE